MRIGPSTSYSTCERRTNVRSRPLSTTLRKALLPQTVFLPVQAGHLTQSTHDLMEPEYSFCLSIRRACAICFPRTFPRLIKYTIRSGANRESRFSSSCVYRDSSATSLGVKASLRSPPWKSLAASSQAPSNRKYPYGVKWSAILRLNSSFTDRREVANFPCRRHVDWQGEFDGRTAIHRAKQAQMVSLRLRPMRTRTGQRQGSYLVAKQRFFQQTLLIRL